jgi:hypothetical protein
VEAVTGSEADSALSLRAHSHRSRILYRRAQRQHAAESRAQEEARLLSVTVRARLSASADTLFLLNRATLSDADVVELSDDAVTVKCVDRSNQRGMVLGTRGFSTGVHYWEVKVEAANWGSVFIGVCAADSRPWSGYGFINYRAIQQYGSERLYGSHFSPGDTIGVLLNMNHGTLTFFKVP